MLLGLGCTRYRRRRMHGSEDGVQHSPDRSPNVFSSRSCRTILVSMAPAAFGGPPCCMRDYMPPIIFCKELHVELCCVAPVVPPSLTPKFYISCLGGFNTDMCGGNASSTAPRFAQTPFATGLLRLGVCSLRLSGETPAWSGAILWPTKTLGMCNQRRRQRRQSCTLPQRPSTLRF